MFDLILEMFSYSFIIRAVIVGILVSLCSALLGVPLVLKRYSMIGDGLSHVGFGALAVASAMNTAPLKIAIPIVVLAAFLLLRISNNSKIKGDSAIAVISTGSLAIGVIILSVSKGMNTDIYNYLFGSILAMSTEDVILSIILSLIVLMIFILFYHRIFSVTLDETFAKATGIKVNVYNMILAALTAVTVVLGMRMMGAMLISALIIFPAVSSMNISYTYKGVTFFAIIISIFSLISGICVSYIFSLPTGASIVTINLLIYIVCSMIKRRN